MEGFVESVDFEKEVQAQRFRLAAEAVLGGDRPGASIGTLGEKTLHAVLKRYYAPDPALHETACGPYVADIVEGGRIIEIQTRQFDRLRRKLAYYLESTDKTITVVYPVAALKWLSWVDPATGNTTGRRRSPRQGRPQDILWELYRIKPLLSSARLRFEILLLEMEEYRLLNGWSHDRKRGSSRSNRWPRALLGSLPVGGEAGYGALVPEELRGSLRETGPVFTSADFARACRLTHSTAQTGLNVLTSTGAVHRVGKRGNAFLYVAAPAAGA